MAALTFQHQPDKHRYEALSDGKLAGFVEYRLQGDEISLLHTETLSEFGGQGVGSFVAKSALQQARKQGWHVVPKCGFIAEYLRKHPDYLDVVSAETRATYKL